jgi:hypothetical protein
VPAVTQQRGSALQFGYTNYTTVVEIPTGEDVLAGTFFLNERPIIILFDSRASHDFMIFACAEVVLGLGLRLDQANHRCIGQGMGTTTKHLCSDGSYFSNENLLTRFYSGSSVISLNHGNISNRLR